MGADDADRFGRRQDSLRNEGEPVKRATRIQPDEVRRGDIVRFDSGRAEFVVQWWEEHRCGQTYLICHGPLGSKTPMGGQAFYVGPKPGTRIDPIDGKKHRIKPLNVYRITERGTR